MLCPLLAKSAGLLSRPRRDEDVLRQFFNYTVRLQDPEICLYHQGWGWGINRTTHSPGFWSRANGWLSMAFVEVLKTIPADHEGWDRLLELYQKFCQAVLKVQDPSGRWHQLLTHPDSFEETSATSMLIYSFLEGYKKGWLSDVFRDSALKAFEGLKEKIDKEGNIYGTCIGTSTQNTLEDYYQRATPVNDWHGQGPVILGACAAASV
jgi:unsaturated rhamnogalacturonyl hydrolase